MTRRTTRTGLDCETLENMRDFYHQVFLKSVNEVLERVIQFHADPTYGNFLAAYNKLIHTREDMIRRDVFETHNN